MDALNQNSGAVTPELTELRRTLGSVQLDRYTVADWLTRFRIKIEAVVANSAPYHFPI